MNMTAKAAVIFFLEASFDEGKSSFDSALARLVRAFAMGRLEADCFSEEI